MASEGTHSAAPVHRFILLTDIAQSSRLAEQYGQQYLGALEEHNQLVEAAVAKRAGEVYKQTGDGYLVLFETAEDCLETALELGEALGQLEPLTEDDPLLVRLALHAGALQPSGSEYFGPALNRASRICQVCNPGQVLLSDAVGVFIGGAGRSARQETAGRAASATSSGGFQLIDLGQHHLRDLAEPEQLYQLDSERFSRREFPPLATLDNRPNNLVSQPNHFIGRERELEELAKLLLGGQRLVSITAPGGYGKSRLAAQLCANLLHRFERGVFMVYLAPVRESSDVPTAIANALGFQFGGSRDPENQLCDYLREKELLLCLDNFEHVMGCAPLVRKFLDAAPKLKIVTTSREPLRLQGEHIFRLEPLPVEASGAGQYSEAQTLFADRAALVSSGFALNAGNAAQVQQICVKLSGIPLAIELAAAWMDTFALGELSHELSEQLELEARASDRPERHQSLKASLDWSWNLLGEQQQEMLMRLSTFRGGFFGEAASEVLGIKGMKLRSALGRLADKSWLYSRVVDGQARFYLRDMLAHEYAFARLEETRFTENSLFEKAVRSHAQYFVALVKREGPRLNGGGTPDDGAVQVAALKSWGIELDNILEALDTALSREEVAWLLPFAQYLQTYLNMASAFYLMRDRYRLFADAVQDLGSTALLAHCQNGLGFAHWLLCDYDAGRKVLACSLASFRAIGDRQGEARSLAHLSIIEFRQGNYAQAGELRDQALEIQCEIGDLQGKAVNLTSLGIIHLVQGDYDRAEELHVEALTLFRQLGNRQRAAMTLGNLANVHLTTGEFARAAELQAEALEALREIGDRMSVSALLGNLARVHYKQGNYARVAELQAQSLAIDREIGNRQGQANSLNGLALAHQVQGDYAQAAELHGEALAIKRELGDRHGEANSLGNLANIQCMQGDYALAVELHSQSLAIRRELDDRQGEASSLGSMADVYFGQGDYARSAKLLEQSLAIYLEIGNKHYICVILVSAGLLLATDNNLPPASICMYGALQNAGNLGYHFEPTERDLLERGLEMVEHPETGLGAEEREKLKAQAESMSLDELAEFALAALAKLKAVMDEDQSTGQADVTSATPPPA